MMRVIITAILSLLGFVALMLSAAFESRALAVLGFLLLLVVRALIWKAAVRIARGTNPETPAPGDGTAKADDGGGAPSGYVTRNGETFAQPSSYDLQGYFVQSPFTKNHQ
jgi:hypothetical protein